MNPIELRHVVLGDAELLFNWANDPEVRKNAIHTDTFTWDNHVLWLNSKLSSGESIMYIGMINKIPFGQIRFDKGPEYFFIDYSVADNFRGKGLGIKLVETGTHKFAADIETDCIFTAYVKPENHISSRVFERCRFINKGFTLLESTSVIEYQLKLPQ